MARPLTKPSVDSPEAIEALIGYLSEGDGMEAACAHPECPSSRSVYRRMMADVEFGGIIARAREAQQHSVAEQVVALADTATPENWQVVKLQMAARQWHAAKLAPKVYGDRVTQEHVGSGGGPVAFVIYGERESEDATSWQDKHSPK